MDTYIQLTTEYVINFFSSSRIAHIFGELFCFLQGTENNFTKKWVKLLKEFEFYPLDYFLPGRFEWKTQIFKSYDFLRRVNSKILIIVKPSSQAQAQESHVTDTFWRQRYLSKTAVLFNLASLECIRFMLYKEND